MGHTLPSEISGADFSAVYNALSLVIASMGATTVYIFLQSLWVGRQYKGAVCISGIVTLIAFYHYFRIFNSWTEAYDVECNFGQCSATNACDKRVEALVLGECTALATGKPFNDAYRYMDWLLTVPLLLCELVLVMNLKKNVIATCAKLGLAAMLMVILGYPGEVSSDDSTRWIYWALAMIPFLYVVYTLFVGLSDSIATQPESVKELISTARWVTIISWLTYPVVFVLPMLGLSRDSSEVGIQIGYSVSDVISKCAVGLMVTYIAKTRATSEENTPLIN